MALTQVSTGGIKDGQVHTADLADAQITAGKLHADALDHTYTLGASGTDHYTFTGEGLTGAVNDPTLYLTRGKTYRFVNGNSAGAHPFRIQTTVNGSAGTEYNTGVTNNGGAGGSTIIFEVPHAAPDVLYYQCTSHGSMGGILYVTGALADGTVTTAKLADDAVDADKLANSINSAIAANTAKDLTALSASNLTSGTVPDARISASSVTQHTTSFDDNNIINDISALALKVNAVQNATRYNTNSTSVETFQDANGIASITNAARHSNEYVATSSESTIVSNGTLIETGYNSGNAFESNTSDNGYVAQGILIKPNTKIVFKNVSFYGHGTGGGSTEKLYISGNSSNSLTTIPSNANDYYQYTYSNTTGLIGGALNNNITIDNLLGGSNLQAWLVVETTGFGGGMIAGKLTGNSTSGAYYNALGTNYVGAQIDQYINSGASMTVSSDEIMAMKLVGDVIQTVTYATGNFISNAITASASTSKMGVVITYIDNAGTATLNTDLKVSVSADNGSNFTQVTLVAQPDFATGVKMALANDVTVTAGTQLKYKVEFANQSSGSKETRVTGVSLQY